MFFQTTFHFCIACVACMWHYTVKWSQSLTTLTLYLVDWTISLIGLINVQSATSAAASCLPSTLAVWTGTATSVLGIISNFKSVLLAVGGHLVATWEHILLSAVCTHYLIQFGLGTCIPQSLTAIFELMWPVGVVTIYQLVPRPYALLAPRLKFSLLTKWNISNFLDDQYPSELQNNNQ